MIKKVGDNLEIIIDENFDYMALQKTLPGWENIIKPSCEKNPADVQTETVDTEPGKKE